MAKRKKKKVTMRAGGGTVASKTGRPIFTTSMPDIQAMPADTSLRPGLSVRVRMIAEERKDVLAVKERITSLPE